MGKKGSDKPASEGFIEKAKHVLSDAIYGKAPAAKHPVEHKAPAAKPAEHKTPTAKHPPSDHKPAAGKTSARAEGNHNQPAERQRAAKPAHTGDAPRQKSQGHSSDSKQNPRSKASAPEAQNRPHRTDKTTPATKHEQTTTSDSKSNRSKTNDSGNKPEARRKSNEAPEAKGKAPKEAPKSKGINFKDVVNYLEGKTDGKSDAKDDLKSTKKAAQDLVDEFKKDAGKAIHTARKAFKPVEDSFKGLKNELQRQAEHIADLLPKRPPEQRKPRQMSPEEMKREERIARMKPEERAKFKLTKSEDPKTHVLNHYNEKGLLTDSETLSGQKKHIEYKPGSKEPAKLEISQAGDRKPQLQYHADVNHRIFIDQSTGDARVDSKQVTKDGKTQDVEDLHSDDGSHTKIISQKGHRLSKEMSVPTAHELKKIATLEYKYTDEENRPVPPEKIDAKTKCVVTQNDANGAARRQFAFDSVHDTKEWKPKTLVDIEPPRTEKSGATTQKTTTYDMTKGKVRVSETDTTTTVESDKSHQKSETFTFDKNQNKTKVSESDVSIVTKGSVATQTTDNFEYVNGKPQKTYHSQETIDKATGNSSSEQFAYADGKIVAKDFSRKEVGETNGDTKVVTTAIRKDKIVQHREAQFDGQGKAVSLKTEEGGHTSTVKFGPDGKVATTNGKPDIIMDGKPLSTEGLNAAEKKKVQAELKALSSDATTFMSDARERYDVRAQVKISQADEIGTEEANRKAAQDRAKAGTKSFTDINGVHYNCDDQGRIIEQTKDNISTTVTYDGASLQPSHVSIHPPGTPDGGEYHSDAFRQVQLNQANGVIRVTQLNATGFKVWEERFAAADNLSARTTYSYLGTDQRPTDDPNKIDPSKTVTARTTNRDGKITDQYQFSDVKHATARNADQHIAFDPKSGHATRMEMREKSPRGGDSLVEYKLKDGAVTSIHRDGKALKDIDPGQKSQIEQYLKGVGDQYYPKDANGKLAGTEQAKPVELTEEDKRALRAKAEELRYHAGFTSTIPKADGRAMEQILESLRTQEEIDEFKRQYRIASNGETLEQQMSQCKYFQGSGADLLQALLTKDEAKITALRVHRALTEHSEYTGRTSWQIDTDLRLYLGHKDSAQMDAAREAYKKLYPGEDAMDVALRFNKNIPQEIKDALPFYMRGVDRLSERDKLKMADIAVENKNVDMFKEVVGRFDDKTRALYNNNDARQAKLTDAFSGRQLQQVQAAAQGGVNSIAQEIRDNSGAWTNREGVRNALTKMTDEQRRQYMEGKALDTKGNLTPEQEKSVQVYRAIHSELTAAVSTSLGTGQAELLGLEDNIAMKNGGLISEVSKGAGYVYHSGAQEQLDKIANMTEGDWQKLHDYVKGTNGPGHAEYRQQLEQTLRNMQGYRIQEAEITKILTLYDKKMGADTFSESKLSGQKDVLDVLASQRGVFTNDRSAALNAIANMTPEEQKRYRTDINYQNKVDAELQHFTQFTGKSHAYEQAERMLNMYRTDKTGVLAQFRTLSNMPEQERNAFANNEAALKGLKENIDKMPENESKHAAQRMLTQLQNGRPPEMQDIFVKLAAKHSQYIVDPRETIKDMEQAFKDDPALLHRIRVPKTEEDRKLAAQFKELSDAALGSNSSYGDALVDNREGRLSLTQKIDMHTGWVWTDRQGILNDLAGASREEISQLRDKSSDLRKKVDNSLNDWQRGYLGMSERDRGQQQVVEKVLNSGKLETHDKLRSYILDVGYSSKIVELLHNTPPEKMDQLCADYAKTYHRDLRADLISKLNKTESKEALNLLYKPTSSEDLYRHVLDQYLDTRAGFGSSFADSIGRSGTGHQLDNSINQITNILTDAHRSGKPISPEQERRLINNVNGAVEGFFNKDLSNFQESKSAAAEYTGTVVTVALTVLGTVATGGGLAVAEGTVAGLETAAAGLEVVQTAKTMTTGARCLNYLRSGINFAQSSCGDSLINVGMQMSMLGNDYDASNIPLDLATGFAQGKIFDLAGPAQAGRLMRLGEGTAEMTTKTACASILKDEAFGLTKAISTEQGQKVFQNALKREVASSIREAMLMGGTELAPGALRTATGKALRETLEKEMKQSAGKISSRELEKRVQNQLVKLAEEKIGPQALREMRENVEEQVRNSLSKLTPAKLVEQKIEKAMSQQLAEVVGGSCEQVLANSLDEAGKQQCKKLIKGLVEFSGDQTHLVTRTLRGMGTSVVGSGMGGTASGVMQGLLQWDRTKSFEENMTAMREHITGGITSSIIGAMQTHPFAMLGHHAPKLIAEHQLRQAEPYRTDATAHALEVPEGTIHAMPDGVVQFIDHSGGQVLNRDGKVFAVRDAQGNETHISYDENGAVNKMDVSSPSGSQRWTREADGQWTVDSAHGSYTTGERVSVTGDGRIVFDTEFGTKQIKHLDGSVEYVERDKTSKFGNLNEDVQRKKLETLIDKQVEHSGLNNHLRADMDILSERIITTGKDRRELARTFAHTSEMLKEIARLNLDPEAQHRLQQVVEETLWMAAHPPQVSQGWHPTCLLASAESRSYAEHPAETMKIMKELALTGEYRCPDGTVLRPFTADGINILHPDADALSHYQGMGDREDGRRLFASQMFQTLLVQAHYADHDRFDGEYVGKGNIGYLNDHIVDLSTHPPRVLSEKTGPRMSASDITWAFEKLTGRHEDFVLLNRRYDDARHVRPEYAFDTPEQFAHALFSNQARHRLPLSIQLNTFHEPFYTDSGAHHSAAEGGEHMVNVVKVEVMDRADPNHKMIQINPANLFDPVTGKLTVNLDDVYVSVTNQWGKSSNHIYKKIPLSEVFRATTDPMNAGNLRTLENEIQSHPGNLDKQLDLLRYKHEFEKRREALSDAVTAEPKGKKAEQLAAIDRQKDCVSTEKLIEEIDKLTSLKLKQIAERPRGLDHPTKEDMAMLDKAKGLLESAQKDINERLARAHHGADQLPTASRHNKSSDVESPAMKKAEADAEQLRKRLNEIEFVLNERQSSCLRDAKVKGTLSEFGFEYKLAQAITAAENRPDGSGQKGGVVTAFIDLNNFKNVNVFHSMKMGDKALEEFGKEASKVLMKYGIDPSEALGHFGGDEFGILLVDRKDHLKILNEIMRIRIGCKPVSDNPLSQETCEFVTLGKNEKFEHTSYKVEVDSETGKRKISEEASPVISATLGAVRWKPGMSAEDVLQTADKVMFKKKPVVKAQLQETGSAVSHPFVKDVVEVKGQKDSEQLTQFNRLVDRHKGDFVAHGMTREQLMSHSKDNLAERSKLYFDLLHRHRHTQILDKPQSKKILEKYIESATKDGDSSKPFTIIRLSVDNFKQVNDRMQSHAKGNRVLREVGNFLRTLDADFVGSLGGTSPFLIVKDPSRVDEIMKKCDEYFLKVSKEDPDPKKIGKHTDISAGEIAVGLSAGQVQWKRGMDIETLLNKADNETEKVQHKHIEEGRHTRRVEENQGTLQRRASDKTNQEKPQDAKVANISLAERTDHLNRRKGNSPDVRVGDWTYANFNRNQTIVAEPYLINKMHVRQVERGEDGKPIRDKDGKFKVISEHTFFTAATRREFADKLTPMLKWDRVNPDADPDVPETLRMRTSVAQDAINAFMESKNLPPIELKTGPEIDAKLNKLNAKAGYVDSTGAIWVRSADLLNAANPAFIAALYHEVLHAEQDVAMIRASALDTVRARVQNSDTQHDSNPIDPVETRKHYLMVSGHYNMIRDAADSTSQEKAAVESWINKVVSDNHSKTWVNNREHVKLDELRSRDVDYQRADWLRKSYFSGEAKGERRVARETESQVDARIKYLGSMVSDSFSRPFRPDEAKHLQKLAGNSNERVKIYGYDPLATEFDNRDKTFTDLLKTDSTFADLVIKGERGKWLKAYETHVEGLKTKRAECDAQIKALDPSSPDYKTRLQQIEAEKPDVQDGPRTLKMLTRWELKGLIHGMEQRDWKEIYETSSPWNYTLSDHIRLVGEDAVNHKSRVHYSTYMRKGEEQEAHYVTKSMEECAAEKIAAIRSEKDHGPESDQSGLVHSRKLSSDSRLANVSTEDLRLLAGGKWANEKNIEHITEALNLAMDQMHIVDPETNIRLQVAKRNWQEALEDAHVAIKSELPDLLPEDISERNFLDRKNIRQALKEHPDLLEMYDNAVNSYTDYRLACRDEVNFVRRANAERINQALAEIAAGTGEPPMEVFATHLGSASAAHKLGTNRLFITDEALRGMVPLDQLIKDIGHEFSHNAQNALIVRKLANDLKIDSHPTDEQIIKLQNVYKDRVGQPLETEYLLSALKGNRKISEGDNQRAEILIKSFAEIRDGDRLRNEKNIISSALQQLETAAGVDAIMERILQYPVDPSNIKDNPVLKLLFPHFDTNHMHGFIDKYRNNKEQWAIAAENTRNLWKVQLEGRLINQNELIAQHQIRYQDWAHEKESSAVGELVARYLQENHGKRWSESDAPKVTGDVLGGLHTRLRNGDNHDTVFEDGLVMSDESRNGEPTMRHRGVINLTDALVKGLENSPLTTAENATLAKLGLDSGNFNRATAEQFLLKLTESKEGTALLEQISQGPLGAVEMKGVKQIYDNNERIVFGEASSLHTSAVIEKVRAKQLSALDDTLILLETFTTKSATSVLNAKDSLQMLQAQQFAERGIKYLDRLEDGGRISEDERSMRNDLKKQLDALNSSHSRADQTLNKQIVELNKVQLGTAQLDTETRSVLAAKLDQETNKIFERDSQTGETKRSSADLASLNETANLLIRLGTTDDTLSREVVKTVCQRDLKNPEVIDAVRLAQLRLELLENPHGLDDTRGQIVLEQLNKTLLKYTKEYRNISGEQLQIPRESAEARLQLTRALSESASETDGRFERLLEFADFADRHPDIPIGFRQVSAMDTSEASKSATASYLNLLTQHAKNSTLDLKSLKTDPRVHVGDDVEDLCSTATMRAAQRGDLGDWTFIPTGKNSTADSSKIDGFFMDLKTGEMVPIDFTERDKGSEKKIAANKAKGIATTDEVKWFYQLPQDKAVIFANNPEQIHNFIDAMKREGMTFSLSDFEKAGIPFPSIEHWTGPTPASLRDLVAISKGATGLSKGQDNWSHLAQYAMAPVTYIKNNAHPRLHSTDPMRASMYGVAAEYHMKRSDVDVPDNARNQIKRDIVDALDAELGSKEVSVAELREKLPVALEIARVAPNLRQLGVSDPAVMKDIVVLCRNPKISLQEAAQAWTQILPGITSDGATLADAVEVGKLHSRLRAVNVTVSDSDAFKAAQIIAQNPNISPLVSVAISRVPSEYREQLVPQLSGTEKITKEELVELALNHGLEAEGSEEKAWTALHKAADEL